MSRSKDPTSHLDTQRFPLVRLAWPDHDVSDATVAATYDGLGRLLAAREPFVVLVTFAGAPRLNAKQRQYVAEFINAHAHALHTRCYGLAVVSTHEAARGLVTSLDWLSGTPFVRRMFDDERTATAWLRERLGTIAQAAAR